MSTAEDEVRIRQLRKLTEVSRALTYAASLDELLQLAVVRGAELFEADGVVLLLLDRGENRLRVRAAYGVDEAAAAEFAEAPDGKFVPGVRRLFGDRPERCFLEVPVVVRGQVGGLLAVARPPGRPYEEEDALLLSALAGQVGVALGHASPGGEEEPRGSGEPASAAEVSGASSEKALATLAHDLRSPLHAIEAYAQVLELGVLGPISERQREAVERIRVSGHHLLSLVERVLEMARLTTGAGELRAGPVRVGPVMAEAAFIVRPEALVKGQTLVVRPARQMWVQADPDRLREVLVNLLENAVKYTPAGKRIVMHASVMTVGGQRWGTISVTDRGPGIPADQLEAIFRPFYQIVREPGRRTGGTGLGLAISRELVRQMGGEIEVRSQEGRGATFIVRLRLADPGPLRPRAARSIQRQP